MGSPFFTTIYAQSVETLILHEGNHSPNITYRATLNMRGVDLND